MLRGLKKWIKQVVLDLQIVFSRPNYDAKIICIGFNKTGISSVGYALRELGFSHLSFNRKYWRKYYAKKQYNKLLKIAAHFDSFNDLPWLKEDVFPLMDKTFPNSKFIFIEREEEPWKKSIYHWTFKTFGYYPNVEEKVIEYKRHRNFVLKYFENRPLDLLILNVKDEAAYAKLAHFLGRKDPGKKFPHKNKTFRAG